MHDERRTHEHSLISAFIVSEKRARILESLDHPKRRRKFLDTLYHFRDLDPRWIQPIPAGEHTPSAIASRLRRLGAPADCWIISSNPDLDGRSLDLIDALTQIVGRGEGAILSCLPGELAYFEGEDAGYRLTLCRPPRRAGENLTG
jgi:hypothetical protein